MDTAHQRTMVCIFSVISGNRKVKSLMKPMNNLHVCFLSRALLFGGAGNSKGPLLLFMISVLLWGYPMYLLKCIPLTWNLLRGSHYCFIYWNILMWISWIVANRRDPGYVPQNSDTYYRAIKQVQCMALIK